VARAPVKAVVMFAAVVLAGLTGFGGAQWTDATFTNTKTVTGNVLATAGLSAPTALVVTPDNGTLVLTWGITSSTYADGYQVYRAAASGGPYTNVATVAGRATATWTDTTPPGGVNYYKLAAYRYNWLSAETAVSQGAAGPATLTYNGTTNVTVPPGVNTVHIKVAGGADNFSDLGAVVDGDMAVVPGDVLHLVFGPRNANNGGDTRLTRNVLPQAVFAEGGWEDQGDFADGVPVWNAGQVTGVTTPTNSGAPYVQLTFPLTVTASYNYTGSTSQYFTVPAGVTFVSLAAKGSPDDGAEFSGGIATGDLVVTPGQVLDLRLTRDNFNHCFDAQVYRPYPTMLLAANGGQWYGEQDGTGSVGGSMTNGTAQWGGWWSAATATITYTRP
jgi:hypothetical protein